ncbi:MAG: FHA domain-containing protein [Myxococcota bacterium]
MPALLTRTLGVICPSCDYLNVVGAVRCMACGSATEGAAAKPETPKLQAAPVQVMTDASSEATVRASALPGNPADLTPPGLKRSHTGPGTLQQAPPLGTVPPGPSGVTRGPPARPTFSSSAGLAQSSAAAGPRFGLTVMAGPARGQRFKLGGNGAQIGRARGAILFPDDPFISPLHASLIVRDGRLFVRDEESTSGVFVSISGTETVPSGSMFCAGLRLFRFLGAIEPNPPWNRRDVVVYGAPLPNNQTHYAIEEILLGGRAGRCLITPGPVLTIGQGRCDFAYPNDEGLAPRHCELSPLPTGVMLRDLSGGLGTFVRASGERALKAGDRIRIGQQTLQVEALG